MAGEYWVGRDSVSNLVQYLRNLMQSTNEESKQKKFGLTPRELEIVSAVVAGYANREIAEYFKISEDTVKHHLSNIFDKLGVSTRLELALFAVNQGLPLKTIIWNRRAVTGHRCPVTNPRLILNRAGLLRLLSGSRQSRHGLDARGATGRNVTCQQSRRNEEQRHRQES